MKIRFKEDCELIVVEWYDEETDHTEESDLTITAGEEFDVDEIENEDNKDVTDFQFGDGSMAYKVPNRLFEVLETDK